MTKWFLPIVSVLFILGCGGGSSVDENITEPEPVVNTPEPDPVYGTPLSDPYCEEIPNPANRFLTLLNLVQSVADGNGGSIKDTVEENSEQCGYEPQMSEPTSCPATATNTGHPWYDYVTCDGVLQSTSVDFAYDPESTETAIIDLLAVVDSNLSETDTDGLSYTEFVQRELDFANKVFADSGVYIKLRLIGMQEVDVADGDLRRQYDAFFNAKAEFEDLDTWQQQADADIAFLFKRIPDKPIACGVASLDATRGLDKSRGITQCYQNSVFQESAATRYYERAHETFTHEIGHLLGLQHHFGDHSGPGIFEYSFGYLIPEYNAQSDNPDYAGVWGGYGTIMSYSDLATGRFSDIFSYVLIPQTGQSVSLGTNGGCFCLTPIQEQQPPTHAVEHLNRVRYVMSQLSEHDHDVEFSPVVPLNIDEPVDICLF